MMRKDDDPSLSLSSSPSFVVSRSGLTTDVVFAFFRVKLTAAVVASFLVIVFLICFGIFLFTRHSATPGIILFIGDGFGPASMLVSLFHEQ